MNDIEQIRAVMQATYAAISGPAGTRDWDAHAGHAVPECRSHVLHRGDGWRSQADGRIFRKTSK